jgi:flagellar biosynthetic protein FliP
MSRPTTRCLAMGLLLAAWLAQPAAAQESSQTGPASENTRPTLLTDLDALLPMPDSPQALTTGLKILVVMTVLSLAPAIFMMTTSFVRILIVLGLVRQALGLHQVPPGQVITALALMLSIMVMAPTWQAVHAEAIEPFLENRLSPQETLQRGARPVRAFMIRQLERSGNVAAVELLMSYTDCAPPQPAQPMQWKDVPTHVLVPAFMLGELKTALVLGFRVYLPFLVIDMVISSILISMGMMMLPPVLISLPFKILLFVLADGWNLLVGSLLQGFS